MQYFSCKTLYNINTFYNMFSTTILRMLQNNKFKLLCTFIFKELCKLSMVPAGLCYIRSALTFSYGKFAKKRLTKD